MLEIVRETTQTLWNAHHQLALFNQKRMQPTIVDSQWRLKLAEQYQYQLLEGEILELERAQIAPLALKIFETSKEFLPQFERLRETGPGQNDPLFKWLAEEANHDEMRWFIEQEVAGEAGFDDLAALTQIKLPIREKMEIAKNYWDEMGRGQVQAMHGPMLTKLAEELEIRSGDLAHIVPETLALGNIMLGLALNRRYAYHSIGALGVVELTAPGRAEKVYQGLKRLGLSAEAQRYYRLHSTIDIRHSETWNREVVGPLVARNPNLGLPILEGALMRLNAGLRCFERYRKTLRVPVKV